MQDFEAIWVVMLADEVDQMLGILLSHGDYRILPEWTTEATPRQYATLREVPAERSTGMFFEGRCMFWDRAAAPPIQILAPGGNRTKYHLLADSSEVIYLRYHVQTPANVLRGRLEVTDWVQQRDGTYGHRSAGSCQAWEAIKKWLRERRSGREPILDAWVTAEALARLHQTPHPPDWTSSLLLESARHNPAQVCGRKSRKSYQASFDEVKAAVGLEGSPMRGIHRVPSYKDKNLGPSWFRTEIAQQLFCSLTLPGLYIGRSQLTAVSFQGSDLHLSTLNWNDVQQCDFSLCDLSQSDLRGCRFEACKFAGADLSQADLRYSTYGKCDFGSANLKGAILHRSQRGQVLLSPKQLSAVAWTDDMGSLEEDVETDR